MVNRFQIKLVKQCYQQKYNVMMIDLMQGQSIDTGKRDIGYVGLTYSERIALDPEDDLA